MELAGFNAMIGRAMLNSAVIKSVYDEEDIAYCPQF